MDDFDRLGDALNDLGAALKRHIADPISALPAPALIAIVCGLGVVVVACLFFGGAVR